ncbi:hypothetical protein U9M48_033574 [Paspalum notatum var. saurae]|uniref:Uncharacterized protein n=1 Tax=Paspalum notatum var. saurae TaxID=547442 RepID=A0AAQ3U7P2_PASNO
MILVAIVAELLEEYTALVARVLEQLLNDAPFPRRMRFLMLRSLPFVPPPLPPPPPSHALRVATRLRLAGQGNHAAPVLVAADRSDSPSLVLGFGRLHRTRLPLCLRLRSRLRRILLHLGRRLRSPQIVSISSGASASPLRLHLLKAQSQSAASAAVFSSISISDANSASISFGPLQPSPLPPQCLLVLKPPHGCLLLHLHLRRRLRLHLRKPPDLSPHQSRTKCYPPAGQWSSPAPDIPPRSSLQLGGPSPSVKTQPPLGSSHLSKL